MEILDSWLTESVLASLRAWLTLLFAAIAAYLGVQRYRTDRRNATKAVRKPWSLRVSQNARRETDNFFDVRLDDVCENKFRLTSLKPLSPRGTRIATASYYRPEDQSSEDRGYVPNAFANVLRPERDMEGNLSLGGSIRTLDYSTFKIFAELPKRPFWVRSSTVRLVVELVVEEISSSRTVSRFSIRSQPIEWIANKADSTTCDQSKAGFLG